MILFVYQVYSICSFLSWLLVACLVFLVAGLRGSVWLILGGMHTQLFVCWFRSPDSWLLFRLQHFLVVPRPSQPREQLAEGQLRQYVGQTQAYEAEYHRVLTQLKQAESQGDDPIRARLRVSGFCCLSVFSALVRSYALSVGWLVG